MGSQIVKGAVWVGTIALGIYVGFLLLDKMSPAASSGTVPGATPGTIGP